MFLKLHAFGGAIFINMNHVYDFHVDETPEQILAMLEEAR